jgi:hypothetical protein
MGYMGLKYKTFFSQGLVILFLPPILKFSGKVRSLGQYSQHFIFFGT